MLDIDFMIVRLLIRDAYENPFVDRKTAHLKQSDQRNKLTSNLQHYTSIDRNIKTKIVHLCKNISILQAASLEHAASKDRSLICIIVSGQWLKVCKPEDRHDSQVSQHFQRSRTAITAYILVQIFFQLNGYPNQRSEGLLTITAIPHLPYQPKLFTQLEQ